MKVHNNYHLTADGSIVTTEGDVLYFSIDRFRRDICEGNCCFLCGTNPSEKEFNDEHVIPEWVLRELNLFASKVVLPNGTAIRYDRYRVPCCRECNSLLGERVERPVSRIVKGGIHAIAEHLHKDGPWMLFTWLALLFLKTHLKDKAFRWHLDTRDDTFSIAEVYDWEALHHIHCIARSFCVEPEIGRSVLGTFAVCPASLAVPGTPFDYCDLYVPRTVCFRFRDAVMFCVLNDCCACLSVEKDQLFARIKGPLSPLQIREVVARLGYLNLLIKVRPLFHSEFSGGQYRISATYPKAIEIEEGNPAAYGKLMYRACADGLGMCRNSDIEATKEHIRNGRYTFLFDQAGEFIHQSMEFR